MSTVLVLAALAALSWLVLTPFRHPRLAFLFLSGADLSGRATGFFDQPGISYPQNELAGLERSRQQILGATAQGPVALERWQSPADLRFLGKRLEDSALTSSDVAIIEIVAAGVTENDEAWLCWDFGRSGSPSRLRVVDLLQQISTSTRARKLVILDAGSIESLPHEGLVVNDFPRLLQRAVEKTADEHLWLLCSHGPLESSHMLPSAQRSVFGYYLEKALTGAADLNADRQIDVRELHAWVGRAVASYVDRRTGGVESQTPRLFRGGGTGLTRTGSDLAVIVPVVPPPQAAKDTAATSFEPAFAETGGQPESKEGNKQPAAAASDNASVSADASSNGNSNADAAGLLSEAWRLTDRLRQGSEEAESAVSLAPRLLGELNDSLRGYEALVAGANNASPTDVRHSLETIVVPLRDLYSKPRGLPGSGSGLGTRVARVMQHSEKVPSEVISLALAEQLEILRIRPLPAGFREFIDAFDQFLVQEDRSGFDEWAAKLKPEALRLAELQIVGPLLQTPDLDWTVIRAALSARRAAERAAVRSLGHVKVTHSRIEMGDQLRLAGERLLLDDVQPDRQRRAATVLRGAVAAYQAAESQAVAGSAATKLKDDLVFRAADYVRWRAVSARRSDTAGPDYELLTEFLVGLRGFCRLVESQHWTDPREVSELSARLIELRARIEAPAALDSLSLLATSASRPDDIALIEGLLTTSLVAESLRPRLAAAAVSAAKEFSLESPDAIADDRFQDPGAVARRQRQQVSQQVRLELLLVQLAELNPERDPRSEAVLKSLTQAADAVQNCEANCVRQPNSAERLAGWWEACGQFRRAWQLWNRDLPERLLAEVDAAAGGSAAELQRSEALHGVSRRVGLLSDRGRRAREVDDLIAKVRQADWTALWESQASRAEASLSDAPVASSGGSLNVAEQYRRAAVASNPRLRAKPIPDLPLALSGDDEKSLTDDAVGEVWVTLQNRLRTPQDIWLVADYDPTLVDVRFPPDFVVLRETSLATTDSPQEVLVDPAASQLPPALTLDAGADRKLKFSVRRRGARAWPTKLIVKALGQGGRVRHECTVHIPAPETVEVAVDGLAKSWTAVPTGFVLHPFPNQRTVFQMLLRSRGPERALDLELFALERRPAAPLPSGLISSEQAERVFRNLPLGPSLAAHKGLKLTADGVPRVIPFAGAPPPELKSEGGKERKPAAKPAGIASVPFGMLLVATDPASGNQILKSFEFAPQRPRRYVSAQVDYNPEAHVVEVVVRRRDRTVSPEQIRVRCELTEPVSGRRIGRPAGGEISAGQLDIRFTLPVVDGTAQQRLAIAVDDYPRAFLYNLSSLLAGGQIPEETAALAIRVTSPAPGGQWACPLKTISARVEVDAPTGSLPEGGGSWEIGIDKDRDRELVGDAVVRFVTDRQVQATLSGFLPQGQFAIDAEVGDFEVLLPADGICNQRALVVGHASVLGRQAWSDPVDIVLDGAGPRITQIRVGADRPLIAGKELEIGATVSDGDLSGVARVDASFDLDGMGRFPKEPPPVAAALAPDGTWNVKLPTTELIPGNYVILLRSIDVVGNVGEYARTVVRLRSQADLDQERSAIRIALRGTVEYNRLPVPGIQVKLLPVKEAGPDDAAGAAATAKKAAVEKPPVDVAEPIEPVLTDKNGTFRFAKVPLGKFKLQASGIFRNKTRETDLEITIDEQTPFSSPPRLKLP